MLLRAAEREAGPCKQAARAGEGHLAQTGGANSVKQKEAESGTAAQDRFWSALPWHVLVRLLPWESVLEARTMFSFTGLFQSPQLCPCHLPLVLLRGVSTGVKPMCYSE